MLEKYFTIACNEQIIANHILIPEDDNEKVQGMRGRKIEKNIAMLFIFPYTKFLTFNMYDVIYTLGIIVLNEEKEIVHVGIMLPRTGRYSGFGKYVLEVHPDNIQNLKNGDIVEL